MVENMEIQSYATIEFADDYFGNIYGSKWNDIDVDDKQKLLNNATINIDSLEYKGRKKDENQGQKFPRIFCDGSESDPNIVSAACCEEAYGIYLNNGINPNEVSITGGFSIGNVSVDNAGSKNDSLGYDALFSTKAIDYLKPYLKSGTSKILL
jgi:uncharacterized protein YjdB